MNLKWSLFAILALLIALSAIGNAMLGPEPGECQAYHEMREIYQETNGEFGWPQGAVKGCD